jgi:hypothetical protein
MGTYRSINLEYQMRDPESGPFFSLMPLLYWGLNLPVTIQPASVFSKLRPPKSPPVAPITLLAHVDTGARASAIDVGLAEHLGLIRTGSTRIMTAGGLIDSAAFIVDLQFPGSTLSPITNLPINSCRLNFDVTGNLNNIQNFGLLLGRDVMSFWNIVWNGPTSTVIIND